ncbi:hypothetical protein CEXT_591131 [Caerostris extrusa]|uniref:Uncharacterized protein n=1 Tax=Caerostris extrusa TaxID=172846 RepID=A0AAV4MYL1_CAEEX|nr:hypothetical protein CEXT_591131 [Caerostris extrusa]
MISLIHLPSGRKTPLSLIPRMGKERKHLPSHLNQWIVLSFLDVCRRPSSGSGKGRYLPAVMSSLIHLPRGRKIIPHTSIEDRKKPSPISSQSTDRFVFLRCLPQTILWGDSEIDGCLSDKAVLDPLRTRGIKKRIWESIN